MDYLVDAQFFKKSSGELIFKEVAVLAVEEDAVPSVYLFKPPHKWKNLLEREKSEISWLENNYHRLTWSSGTIPYRELIPTLKSLLKNARTIYVKGLEKEKFLKKIFKNIKNLDNIGCPSLTKLQLKGSSILCNHHHTFFEYSACAVRNASLLQIWLLDNYRISTSVCSDGIDEVGIYRNTMNYTSSSNKKSDNEKLLMMYN